MGTDWRTLLRDSEFELDGEDVIVGFRNDRSHRVRVREIEEAFEFHAVVAGAGAVREVPGLALRIWRHNRSAQLVSFRIDARDRVYAVGWVPKAGLTAQEFQTVLCCVASESDRLEFLLTGRDAE